MDSYQSQKSQELVELRTVLSRSKTAYDTIRNLPGTWAYREEHTVDERIRMQADLMKVIDILAKYDGKKKSRHQRMRDERDG
jgi:hypothetical protein